MPRAKRVIVERVCAGWAAGLCLAGIAFSQHHGEIGERTLASAEIIARMLEMDRVREANLREYTSIRRYRLENTRFRRVVETIVHSAYRAPEEKKFTIVSESGSKVIGKKVFHRMLESEREAARAPLRQATRITPDNYNFRFVGDDFDRGRPAYVFEISPKVESRYTIKGRIWLDHEDFAISRIEGSPVKRQSIWISSTHFVHTYEKHGPHWLAATNTSQSESAWFGRTRVLISYTDYDINAGESGTR
jgi:hypothetical protein